MQAISHFLFATRGMNCPILTHYHSFRDEISGPVAARWVAKMANLLASDLSPDLFGDDSAQPSAYIHLPQGWQSTFWQISAFLMGWTVRNGNFLQEPSSNSFSFDVHVSDTYDELVASHASWRLAHSTAPLAMRWQGSLEAGILDALAELMAQSDQFEYAPRDDAPTLEDFLSTIPTQEQQLLRPSAETQGPMRIGLYTECFPSPPLLTSLWTAGHSVVVVDASHASAERADEIFASEKVDVRLR